MVKSAIMKNKAMQEITNKGDEGRPLKVTFEQSGSEGMSYKDFWG